MTFMLVRTRPIMYRFLIKQVLRYDPGTAREFARIAVRLSCHAARIFPSIASPPPLPISVMGLNFPNPVGLAAGFDKNGAMTGSLGPTGFGFVEIGTITPDHPTKGNDGIAVTISNLERTRARRLSSPNQVLGINVGSVRRTFSEELIDDYISAMEAVWDQADYLAINLSSPHGWAHAAGVNELEVRTLLERIKDRHDSLTARTGRRIPITAKVAVTGDCIPPAAHIAGDLGFDALTVATKRTEPSDLVCSQIRELAAGLSPTALISVGGITSVDSAWRRLEAGAALVQLYTGLVEQGPFLARRIVRGLYTRYARQRRDIRP